MQFIESFLKVKNMHIVFCHCAGLYHFWFYIHLTRRFFRLNRLFHGFGLIYSNKMKFTFHILRYFEQEKQLRNLSEENNFRNGGESFKCLADMTPEITYIQQQILGRKREVNRGQFFSQQTLKVKRLIFNIFGFRQVTFVFRKNDSKL